MREFSEVEKAYVDEKETLNKVLEITALISTRQHGIQTSGRGVRAVKIFTRQTQVGFSLKRLLPDPDRDSPINDSKLWDIASIASLARNLLEGYIYLHYFGLESVTDEEANFRFLLLQLHRNSEWQNIRKSINPNNPKIKELSEGIELQRKSIRNHDYLIKLNEGQKKRVLSFTREMYKDKSDFEESLPSCQGLKRDYRLLSNFSHPLPVSIERIDDNHGRGIGTEVDITYCMICCMIGRRYLAASTVGIADFFPEHIAAPFYKRLNSIRPLQFCN